MTDQQALDRLLAIRGNPGVRFGVTGPDYAECTAVPHSLERDVLGIDITYGNAIDMYANASDADFIKLPAGTAVQPADIIIQGGDPVLQTSSNFGHVSVGVTQLGGGWFRSYSQNYPTGREPHVRDFPPNGMLGILRARVLQSGGGTNMPSDIDLVYRELFAQLCFLYGPQRIPSRDERRAYMGLAAPDVYNAIVGGTDARGKLAALFVGWYNLALGRSFRGEPIDIPSEINPRVDSIIAQQSTLLDHWNNIVTSAEGVAWSNTLKGGDTAAVAKLNTAKQLAAQAEVPLEQVKTL